MRRRLTPLLLVLLIAATATFAARPPAPPRAVTPRGPLAADEQNNIAVFKASSASVVNITALGLERDFMSLDVQQVPQGTGSGFVWDTQGHVVTNFHVIREASGARVTLADQTSYRAELVGAFPDRDIAVLRIDAPAAKLKPVAIGTSRDLVVGQKVYAIGNPFGLDQTLTTGIVSALDREIESVTRRTIKGAIQTDAAINPGNSGGALIDMKGRVVGINTAIYSRSGGSVGIGFAIPAAMVRLVVDSAKAGATTVKRPWLGARLQALTADVADGLGLDRPAGSVVASVVDKGPADLAGLRRSDVILSVDGVTVDDPEAFGYRFATRPIGGTTMLTVLRSGNRISIPVKLISAPESRPRDEVKLTSRSPLAGLTVTNLSPAVAEELSMETANEGVVVSDVEEGSTAANIGFQKGDIIMALNGERMATSRDVETTLKDRRRAWEVTISRKGQTITSVFPG